MNTTDLLKELIKNTSQEDIDAGKIVIKYTDFPELTYEYAATIRGDMYFYSIRSGKYHHISDNYLNEKYTVTTNTKPIVLRINQVWKTRINTLFTIIGFTRDKTKYIWEDSEGNINVDGVDYIRNYNCELVEDNMSHPTIKVVI